MRGLKMRAQFRRWHAPVKHHFDRRVFGGQTLQLQLVGSIFQWTDEINDNRSRRLRAEDCLQAEMQIFHPVNAADDSDVPAVVWA